MRTAEQIRAAVLAFVDARLGGMRTETGEAFVDLVDAVSEEVERANLLVEYARRTHSIAGWRELLADPAFLTALGAALGLSTTSASAAFVRSVGGPADAESDLAAFLFVDLGRYAASLGRPRAAATFASGTLRLYLPDNGPLTLLRGATARHNRRVALYDTVVDLVGAVPGLDLAQNRFYVDAAIRCRQPGRAGNAIRNSIQAIVSGFANVVAVTNLSALEGGAEVEGDQALLDALEAGAGADINTRSGLRNFAIAQAGVVDALVVGPGESLMARSSGGAVDVYVLGASLKSVTSIVRVLTEAETVVLPIQPVRTISAVTSGAPLSEGNAFVSNPDAGVFAGSVRARTSLTWTAEAQGGPAVGVDVSVSYTYNDLIRDLQQRVDGDPDRNVPSSGTLFKEATRIPVFVAALVVPAPGVDQSIAEAAVETAVLDFVDAQNLGGEVDYSKLLAAAQAATKDGVPAVDHIDNFRLGVLEAVLGQADLVAGAAQYLRLEQITFDTP